MRSVGGGAGESVEEDASMSVEGKANTSTISAAGLLCPLPGLSAPVTTDTGSNSLQGCTRQSVALVTLIVLFTQSLLSLALLLTSTCPRSQLTPHCSFLIPKTVI